MLKCNSSLPALLNLYIIPLCMCERYCRYVHILSKERRKLESEELGI